MSVGPTAPRAEGAIRNAAATRVARSFGPSPTGTGSNKPNIFSELNRQTIREEQAARKEANQDRIEQRETQTRGNRRPIPNTRPGGVGQARGNPNQPTQGSHRNYPQTV